MKTMILGNFGSVDNFHMQDIPIPIPGDGQVLVKVSATSINPIDVKTRIGKGAASWFPVCPPVVLGWDLSGNVMSCGPNVEQWQSGDEVFGSINFPGLGKTNAEYTIATAAHLARKPSSISHEEGAAASMAGLTAWQALTKHGPISAGQKVLIHAASGGVGHMAVQIAKSFGAYVIGTSSSTNRDFVLSLGADEHIDYKSGPFEENTRDLDFVLDTIGGETTHRSVSVLKEGGTLVTILPGMEDRTRIESQRKNIHIHFVFMNSSSADMTHVANLLKDRSITVHISHSLPLDELGYAHSIMETGRVVGKIALICESASVGG